MTPADLTQLNAQCFHVVAVALKCLIIAAGLVWLWMAAPYFFNGGPRR